MAKNLTVGVLRQESCGRNNMKQITKGSLSLNVNIGTAGIKLIFKLDLKNVCNCSSIVVRRSLGISKMDYHNLANQENDPIETFDFS